MRGFADWMQSQEGTLDVLINNAGANFMGVDPWYTPDGIAGGPQVCNSGAYLCNMRPIMCCMETKSIIKVFLMGAA